MNRVIALAVASVLVATAARAQDTASFDSAGVDIHYSVTGDGAPVVLIHGFTGSAQRHWERPGVVQALAAAGYRVIALDCRGHGGSGKPLAPDAYGMTMVDDVVRLLDRLGIARAHLVGYSMGGAIVNQLLVHHADRLVTATLVGAGWEGADLGPLRAEFAAMAEGFDRKDASALIRAVLGRPTEAEIAAANADLFARNDAAALAAAARGMLPLYEIDGQQLAKVSVPVEAIAGELDTSNLAAAKRMATVVRGMAVVEIPGATHATSMRSVAAPLVAFLRSHPDR